MNIHPFYQPCLPPAYTVIKQQTANFYSQISGLVFYMRILAMKGKKGKSSIIDNNIHREVRSIRFLIAPSTYRRPADKYFLETVTRAIERSV